MSHGAVKGENRGKRKGNSLRDYGMFLGGRGWSMRKTWCDLGLRTGGPGVTGRWIGRVVRVRAN